MSNKKEWEQDEARRLRGEGYSINEIAKRLGVSKGSVSNWVRGVQLTEDQKAQLLEGKKRGAMIGKIAGGKANREKFLQLRKEYQDAGRRKAQEGDLLHLIGCILYWAEGAKTRNNMNFVNSDVHMMRVYIKFVRESLQVPDRDIAIHIHCHTKDKTEVKRIEKYWLDTLGLPSTCLRKTIHKKGSDTRHNILEYGVCSIRVYKTEVVHHIYGAIQEYIGFDNPDWLF